jgi:HEAT repeat protein
MRHLFVLFGVWIGSGWLANYGVTQEPSTSSVEVLIKQLENSIAGERIEAAKALGKLGQPANTAVDDLIKLLKDKDPDVRTAGARALAAIGVPAKKAAPELFKLFKDDEWTSENQPMWHIAAEAYAKVAPDQAATLIPELSNEERVVVYAASTAIHRMGPPGKVAVPKLIEELQKNDPERRIAFIYALMGLGAEAEPAMPVLMVMLQSDDFHTRYWACRAIGRVGLPGAKQAVPALVHALDDMVASVRGNAAAALGILGPDVAVDAVQGLTKAVKDRLYTVRTSAVVALGKMGPKAIGSLPAVEACMTSESFAARSQAAVARWQITGEIEPTVKVLVAELENRDTQWDAARGFEQIGKPAAVAVNRLIKLLNHEERETRVWTISSLAAIGASSKPALPKLNELLKDPEEEVREVAAEAIRMIETAEK